MNEEEIHLIEIAQVFVANPRPRNPVKFQALVASIELLCLKKPITVCPRPTASGSFQYELITGQGRMEACQTLGKSVVPAIFADVPRERRYLMSLIENVARRPPSNRALLLEVRNLVDRGYKAEQIAKKIGLDKTHAYGVVHLLEHGENVLLQAVDAGRIPIRSESLLLIQTSAVSLVIDLDKKMYQLRLGAINRMYASRSSFAQAAWRVIKSSASIRFVAARLMVALTLPGALFSIYLLAIRPSAVPCVGRCQDHDMGSGSDGVRHYGASITPPAPLAPSMVRRARGWACIAVRFLCTRANVDWGGTGLWDLRGCARIVEEGLWRVLGHLSCQADDPRVR